MKKFILPFVAVCLVATIVVSCTKSSQHEDIAAQPKLSGEELFRGIVLSDGSLASRIPQLKRVKELSGTASAADLKKTTALQDELVASINRNYPGYLTEFGREINSKDVVRINDAITKASDITFKTALVNNISKLGKDEAEVKQLVANALVKNKEKLNALVTDVMSQKLQDRAQAVSRIKEIFELNDISSRTTDASTTADDCLAINIAIVINVVAAINAALLTNLAAAVNIETMVNIHFEASDVRLAGSQLQKEKLAASIAQNI